MTDVRAAVDWVFKSRETGRLTFAQWPNPPLWIYIAAKLLHALVAWDPLNWIALLALLFWAFDELVRGVNPFRRLLGLVMLITTLRP